MGSSDQQSLPSPVTTPSRGSGSRFFSRRRAETSSASILPPATAHHRNASQASHIRTADAGAEDKEKATPASEKDGMELSLTRTRSATTSEGMKLATLPWVPYDRGTVSTTASLVRFSSTKSRMGGKLRVRSKNYSIDAESLVHPAERRIEKVIVNSLGQIPGTLSAEESEQRHAEEKPTPQTRYSTMTSQEKLQEDTSESEKSPASKSSPASSGQRESEKSSPSFGMKTEEREEEELNDEDEAATYERERLSVKQHFSRLLAVRTHWRFLRNFMDMSFPCPAKERAYQRQDWRKTKNIAAWASVFLVYCWVMLLATLPKPWLPSDYYIYYMMLTIVTAPLPILVYFDAPKRFPWTWQIITLASTWAYPIAQLCAMKICDFYGPNRHCGAKDFQGIFYYSSAVPVLALFCFRQKRAVLLFGAVAYAISCCVLIVPQRRTWGRNVANSLIYACFVIALHGLREQNDRAMFTLQRQLAMQVKKTNEAKEKERASHDSKRRLTHYIFHEVRVPLNIATLAFENCDAAGCFEKPGIDFEYNALKSSHAMMSKVLNDVLDLDRMEMGRFTSVVRPFAFHSVISDIAASLKMTTRAKELNLEIKLDERIDETAKRITESIDHEKCGEGHALVMGDAVRLQQIVTNLTSNAVKFTPKAGSISITTRLIQPVSPSTAPTTPATTPNEDYRTQQRVFASSSTLALPAETLNIPQDVIVVRIEVTDTGVGIRAADLENNKLFSPYVQTEIGVTQGGKGTGLGLSLVRHIVSLSGGRLGVRTKPGEGSTFWVDLQYGASRTSFSTPKASPTLAGDPYGPATKQDLLTAPRAAQITLSTLKQQSYAAPMVRPSSRPRTAPTNKSEGYPKAPLTLAIFDGNKRTTPVESPPHTGVPMTVPEEDHAVTALVVDDDPITRKIVCRLLARLGARTWEAENGKIALDVLHGRQKPTGEDSPPDSFDLCFLDNQMPVMSGVQCVQALRASSAPCRSQLVCAITGNASLQDQQEFLGAGADFILTKPTGEAALKKMLQIALDRRFTSVNTPAVNRYQGQNPMDLLATPPPADLPPLPT